MNSRLEEADLQIVIHVFDAIKSGNLKITFLSNDTDVIVTLLFHMSLFLQNGLIQLWVKGGKDEMMISARFFLHSIGCEVKWALKRLHLRQILYSS